LFLLKPITLFTRAVVASVLNTKTIREGAGRRYDYASITGKPIDSGPAGTPPIDDLLAALKVEFPFYDEQLEMRHLLLQSLYGRLKLAEYERNLRTALVTISPKIGRNDPCPCGSGKKYKRCCLNKTTS